MNAPEHVQVRDAFSRRAQTAAAVALLLIVSSACQSSDQAQSTQLNPLRFTPVDLTATSPSTSLTENGSSTTGGEAPPTIPSGFYIADGFALQPPQDWMTIDRQSVADGSAVEGIPADRADALSQEVTRVLDNGALVAFYRFDGPTQYAPNITVSWFEPQPEIDLPNQAALTEAELQQQGFTNIASSTGTSTSGPVVSVQYTVPATKTGLDRDLFASSHIIFGDDGRWSVTGLTATDSASIDEVVSSVANSFIET